MKLTVGCLKICWRPGSRRWHSEIVLCSRLRGLVLLRSSLRLDMSVVLEFACKVS